MWLPERWNDLILNAACIAVVVLVIWAGQQ
jgi:hypothetical protein